MVDMIRLCCEIEKELSKVARREASSLWYVTKNNGNNILEKLGPAPTNINLSPGHVTSPN